MNTDHPLKNHGHRLAINPDGTQSCFLCNCAGFEGEIDFDCPAPESERYEFDIRYTPAPVTTLQLDTFTRAYIECALWSSMDDDCTPLDANYSADDIAPDTLQKMADDCAKFQSENDIAGYGDDHAGHDFWLTRNRHGCGFWEEDHGTPEQCALLDAAAKAFGTFDLYIEDNRQIHGS